MYTRKEFAQVWANFLKPITLIKGTKMKKLIALSCMIAASTALSACGNSGTGYVDTQAPYAEERTAGGTQTPVARERVEVRTAEPVFERRVTK